MSTRVGLFALAIIGTLQAVSSYVFSALTSSLWEQIRARRTDDFSEETSALYDQVGTLNEVSLGSSFALALAFIVAAVLFALAARGSGREHIVWIGVASYLVAQLLWGAEVVAQFMSDPLDGDFGIGMGTRVLWVLRDLTRMGGLFALVLAAAGFVPHAGAKKGLPIAYGVLSVGLFVLGLLQIFVFSEDHELMSSLTTPWRITAIVAQAVVIGTCAYAGAKGTWRAEPAVAATPQGGPLRLLVSMGLTRIVVGVLATGAITLGMSQGVDVRAPLVLATGVSVICGIGMIVALVLPQHRWPAEARSDGALATAIMAISVSLLLEIWISTSAVELVGLVARARAATSFWGMPSIRDIEGLQAVVAWGGRASQVLGLVGIAAILTSLKATARYLEDPSSEDRAGTALTLALGAGGLALGTGALLSAGGAPGLMLVAIAALLALVLGVIFLFVFVRLCLDLAKGMDRKSATGVDEEE